MCDQTFKENSKLQLHKDTDHVNERYKCEECGKTYKTIKILGSHKKFQHLQKSVKCEECGEEFEHSKKLKQNLSWIRNFYSLLVNKMLEIKNL